MQLDDEVRLLFLYGRCHSATRWGQGVVCCPLCSIRQGYRARSARRQHKGRSSHSNVNLCEGCVHPRIMREHVWDKEKLERVRLIGSIPGDTQITTVARLYRYSPGLAWHYVSDRESGEPKPTLFLQRENSPATTIYLQPAKSLHIKSDVGETDNDTQTAITGCTDKTCQSIAVRP